MRASSSDERGSRLDHVLEVVEQEEQRLSPTCSARPSLAPSACAAVSSTSSGSRSGASGTQNTPCG